LLTSIRFSQPKSDRDCELSLPVPYALAWIRKSGDLQTSLQLKGSPPLRNLIGSLRTVSARQDSRVASS